MRTFQPSLISPTRLKSGTRTLSKKTALVRSPAIVRIGVTVMPGVSVGTMKIVRPRLRRDAGSERVRSQM